MYKRQAEHSPAPGRDDERRAAQLPLRHLLFSSQASVSRDVYKRQRMVNRQLDTVGNQDPPYSMVFSGLSNNCRIALRLALNISDVNHYIIFQYFLRSQSNQLPIFGFQRIFFKGITLNILRHPASLPVWLLSLIHISLALLSME